ncbi:DNA/RNA helicase, DEAD/DEAH box type containing protein [Tanacetum coccineum]
MNWGEELVCIKCLFENQLDDLEPEEAVYLMSGFVFQQRNAYEPSFTLTLLQSKERTDMVAPSGFRHRYSNPMIQPELDGSTQGYPLVSVEVLRYNTKGEKVRIGNKAAEMELTLEQTQQGVSYEVSVDPHGFEGIFKDGDGVLKLKNIKKDALLKLFKIIKSRKVWACRSRSHKFTRWPSLQDGKRLCLDDDFKKLKDHIHVKTKEQAHIKSQ